MVYWMNGDTSKTDVVEPDDDIETEDEDDDEDEDAEDVDENTEGN